MKNFLDQLEKLDIFGVPISLLTNKENEKFQSKLGGITTIVVSSLSLIYFLYIFVLWNNNQLAPTISSKQEILGYAEFELKESVIEIQLLDFLGDIDPFKKENNIITPLLFTFINTSILEEPIPLFSSEDQPYRIQLKNLTIVLNSLSNQDQMNQQQRQYSIVLARCSQDYAIFGSYCADENTINDYLSRFHGFLYINIYLSKLNIVTKEFEQLKKQYYTGFDANKPFYSQIMLKQQKTIIDDGILFNNYEEYNFLNNYEIISQETDLKFAAKVINLTSNFSYDFDSYGCYLFRIDNISIIEEVSYPKLGQVLAQIGSIIQLIFLLKHIIIYYNNLLLENLLFNSIIKMYYPEFKEYKFNLLNQIQISNKNINNIQIPFHILTKMHQALLKGARKKCRLINVLYEISRIQFILQEKFGDQFLFQSHQMGSKLVYKEIEQDNQRKSNRLQIKPFDSMEIENQSLCIEQLELLIQQQ
ncbi:unnamed protein product [Paramecium pentaurelia]|uniref:Transmembrane protein n=1 Tax=Paramecium pentaurelia TaxID=43138 RepID=A0A8S1U5B5_9CILI|nr:unnamed protein product [Paramecium pentaurelia]